jgi:hypothetical protein
LTFFAAARAFSRVSAATSARRSASMRARVSTRRGWSRVATPIWFSPGMSLAVRTANTPSEAAASAVSMDSTSACG